MQERTPIFGITLDEPASVPDSLRLAQDVAIPCPVEEKMQKLTAHHKLDRTDPKVSSVLDKVRKLWFDHPDSEFTAALADRHISNLVQGR